MLAKTWPTHCVGITEFGVSRWKLDPLILMNYGHEYNMKLNMYKQYFIGYKPIYEFDPITTMPVEN